MRKTMNGRNIIISLLLLTSLSMNHATAGILDDLIGGFLCKNPETCEIERECLASLGIKTPYFYCDCKETSDPFTYGTDMIVNDTLWFTAKMADLKKGLTAYWFANGAVQIDIFPTCTSDLSILSISIGKNSAYNLSNDEINKKLEEAGEMGSLAENMSVNIRVAPKNGASGRAIFTPYNEGHHSTCEDPMPVHYKIPYVLSHTDNHYRLVYTAKPRDLAVKWMQNKKEPVRVEVTKGNCTSSEVIASAVLTDSSKVWIPDMDMLKEAYSNKDSLYFNFYTEENTVGRIYFIAPYKTVEYVVDTTVCKGFGLHLADTSLYANTVYKDTFLMPMTDTILFTTYNLTVTEPVAEYDTITVASTEFPFLYKNQAVVNGYGDYPITIRKAGECDRQIFLHVKASTPTAILNGEEGVYVMPTMAQAGEDIRIGGPVGARVQVYSLLGHSVMEMTLQQAEETFSLPVTGQYILKMTTEEGQKQTRIFIK